MVTYLKAIRKKLKEHLLRSPEELYKLIVRSTDTAAKETLGEIDQNNYRRRNYRSKSKGKNLQTYMKWLNTENLRTRKRISKNRRYLDEWL